MAPQTVPPPRRKSCNACVKAKRRCDMLLPQCTRCFQKNIGCVYDGQPPRRRRQAEQESMSTAMAPTRSTVTAAVATINPLAQPSSYALDLPNFDFHATSFEMPTDPKADFGFLEFVPAFPVPPYPEDFPTPESMIGSDLSTRIYTDEDYSHVDDICDDFNSGQLNDDTSRVACAVSAIRNWHRSMAFSCSTPFLHRKLYSHDRPNLITDVFTSCLMYATKTAQTVDVITTLIENNACKLIIEYSRNDISPTVALARVQALLLYQSIRKADYVERDLPILESWLGYLTDLRDKSRQSSSAVASTEPENWDSWIFWESVSRTILAASFFINVHSLIAKGEHNLGEWTKPHMWTASKRLWNAETSEEFCTLWHQKRPLMVCNIFFNNLIAKGDGNEIDAFASMLMVPCLGLETTKQWISSTRGRVVEITEDSFSDLPIP